MFLLLVLTTTTTTMAHDEWTLINWRFQELNEFQRKQKHSISAREKMVFLFARWTTCVRLALLLVQFWDRFPFSHHWPSSISRFYLYPFAVNQLASLNLGCLLAVNVCCTALRLLRCVAVYGNDRFFTHKIPTNVSPECLLWNFCVFIIAQFACAYGVWRARADKPTKEWKLALKSRHFFSVTIYSHFKCGIYRKRKRYGEENGNINSATRFESAIEIESIWNRYRSRLVTTHWFSMEFFQPFIWVTTKYAWTN